MGRPVHGKRHQWKGGSYYRGMPCAKDCGWLRSKKGTRYLYERSSPYGSSDIAPPCSPEEYCSVCRTLGHTTRKHMPEGTAQNGLPVEEEREP